MSKENAFVGVMDEIYRIANETPVEDAAMHIVRYSGGGAGGAIFIEALAHSIVAETVRRKHLEAKLMHAQKRLEEMEGDTHGER